MNVGAMTVATDQTAAAHPTPTWKARGFESLRVTEKTHVPTSRHTLWPGRELPKWYQRTCGLPGCSRDGRRVDRSVAEQAT